MNLSDRFDKWCDEHPGAVITGCLVFWSVLVLLAKWMLTHNLYKG